MVKGRRAADRRREREGGDDPGPDDVDPGTAPALPAHPHSDYEEVDEVEESIAAGKPRSVADGDVDVASAPQARPLHAEVTRAHPDGSPRRGKKVVDDEPVDAEKSFARELKRRPREDTKAREGPEATEVKEVKTRRARHGGRFLVIAIDGQPAAQAEMPVLVYPSLLGRSTAADLVVGFDPTVSLRHAEIGWDDEGFSLVDLGSTSGTLKNGLVVDGRVPLHPGDVVQIGKTELRFFPTDKAPGVRPAPVVPVPTVAPQEGTERLPERPEPTATNIRVARQSAAEQLQRRRRAVRKKAALVIAICLGVAAAVVVVRMAVGAAFSNDAPAQIRMQVAALLGEAKEKLLQGEVDAAWDRVGTVLALDPHNAEGESLLRTVETEKQARDALQLALRMGDEDRDDEALAALARIADTSVFAKDRDRLNQSLAERALVHSLRAVESLLDQGRIEEALARAAAHVKRFPDDEGGKALLARVQSAKAAQPRDPALFPARAAFAEGRVDEARAIAAAAGYPGYVKEIDRFQKALADGKASLTRLDGSAARGPLDEAFRLLSSLGGRASSPIFAQVQKPYADALYLSGTEKLESGDGCGAARDLFKAARVVPEDGRIRVELQKLATRAEQGLTKAQGAAVSDRDRARAIARESLCYAPSGTKIYEELSDIARQ